MFVYYTVILNIITHTLTSHLCRPPSYCSPQLSRFSITSPSLLRQPHFTKASYLRQPSTYGSLPLKEVFHKRQAPVYASLTLTTASGIRQPHSTAANQLRRPHTYDSLTRTTASHLRHPRIYASLPLTAVSHLRSPLTYV